MSQKQEESIWTKDITPHVINFLTMDITPDFSSEFWTKDITHHVIGTLAVFGLVVSSLVTMAGITTAGVNVELAFAQQAAASQTASVVLADGNRPVLPPMPAALGSTTPPMASSTAPFCPKIARTIMRGNHEATTTGDIGQLQEFMAEHFDMDKKDVVTGFFGSTTQGLLMRFQEEQGIPPMPQAGPLTRAAIARLCNPSLHDPATTNGDLQRGDKGVHPGALGSTTMPILRHEDMRPGVASGTPPTGPVEREGGPRLPPMPPAPVSPTSYNGGNTSNAANVLAAMSEIGDGYGRLLTASLSMLGL